MGNRDPGFRVMFQALARQDGIECFGRERLDGCEHRDDINPRTSGHVDSGIGRSHRLKTSRMVPLTLQLPTSSTTPGSTLKSSLARQSKLQNSGIIGIPSRSIMLCSDPSGFAKRQHIVQPRLATVPLIRAESWRYSGIASWYNSTARITSSAVIRLRIPQNARDRSNCDDEAQVFRSVTVIPITNRLTASLPAAAIVAAR